jgi:hypothetical protein
MVSDVMLKLSASSSTHGAKLFPTVTHEDVTHDSGGHEEPTRRLSKRLEAYSPRTLLNMVVNRLVP